METYLRELLRDMFTELIAYRKGQQNRQQCFEAIEDYLDDFSTEVLDKEN